MSEVFTPIFTDAIKDVIGNDPVLDQFDTYYAANFYGTLQDSYITGAMLYDVTATTPGVTTKTFVTGSRAKLFNKFDANSQSPLDDTYGSTEVEKVPNLSYRLVPWKDRISNAYRLAQCFDSQERYYDSCLPDMNNAFAADNSNVWTISDDASFLLSPYANVQSASVGYMIFNGVKSDRSSQGLNSDPLVNNDWTWSYPYETKYSPGDRKTEIREFFPLASISTTTTSFSETAEAKSTYEAINQSLLNKTTSFSAYESFFGFETFTRNTLPKSQFSFEDLSILSQPKSINAFIPLLPGRHEPQILGPLGRNSLRCFVNVTGSLGTVSIPTTVQGDSKLDAKFGTSMLIPTDIKLNSKVSHTYLPSPISVPAPEFFTGSMTYADTIRFLFGYGDLNNMSYGKYSFVAENVTSSYVEGFESYSNGTRAYSVSNYTSDPYLTVKWNVSPTGDTPPQAWQVITASSPLAFYPGDTNVVANYYYVSGSVTAGSVLTSGLAWLSSSAGSKILMTSGTVDLFGGGGYDSSRGEAYSSIASVDITSSYPWTLSYDRAVAGHTSDGMLVYFSAVPGIDNNFSSLGLQMLPLEFVRGKASTANTDTLVRMEKFDLRTSVSSDSYPPYLQGFVGKLSGSKYDYPLPPGNWRLNFAYLKSGSSTAALVANQDVAAIDNFQIFTWRENAFQPVSTIGSNNYPEFRSTKLDSRYNPITHGYNKSYIRTVVTGSSDLYKGLAFGISPIIRGWKYGLVSGFPTHSKCIFRRDRYGQLRDMLEQRQYTKFINVSTSPTDEDATMKGVKIREREGSETINTRGNALGVDSSPVSVAFVKQKYQVNVRNIGRIYSDPVSPLQTTSQNLSNEVTSSLPYFDGVARHRTEGSFSSTAVITGQNIVVDPNTGEIIV